MRTRTAAIAGALLGFVAATTVGALASRGLWSGADPSAGPAEVEERQATAGATEGAQAELPLQAEATADKARRTPVVEAVERVAPAVVSITTEAPVSDPFARFYGQRTTSGQGSGVVIDPDGVVLTNAHVVERASRIVATFADERTYEARILGMAAELDLAVLQLVDAEGLTAVELGTSRDLMLGEPVIAIGNPFGLGHSVTTGVVSSVNRPLETDERVYQDFIQTDASINPGNSGGPLVNVHGQLVGINTAIRADAQGICFAIPVDRAVKVARDIVDHGAVQLPWLAVDLRDVPVGRGGQRSTAPQVVRVHGEGELRVGDIVTAINGRDTQGRADLNAFLAGLDAKGAVTLRVLRAGEVLSVQVWPRPVPASVAEQSVARVLGVALGETDGRYRTPGVQLTEVLPGGAMAKLGLRAGDRIVAVNGRPTPTRTAVLEAVSQAKSGHRAEALFTVARGESLGRATLEI